VTARSGRASAAEHVRPAPLRRTAVRVTPAEFAVQAAELRYRCLAGGDEDAGSDLRVLRIRVGGHAGLVAEHRGRHPEVEHRRPDADPRGATGRIRGGQRALSVEQYVDHRTVDLEPPRLRVVDRRRVHRGRQQDADLVVGQYGGCVHLRSVRRPVGHGTRACSSLGRAGGRVPAARVPTSRALRLVMVR
jgi:hypothetical protein